MERKNLQSGPDRPDVAVAVVVPAWNAERYIAEAIESVLAQTHPVAEIVVVDDGSTDATASICARYPVVRYEYQPNQGAGAARNLGVALTTAELVCFLDADDVWMPKKTAMQVQMMMQSPDVAAVFGLAVNFVSPDRAVELASFAGQQRLMPAFIPSAFMTRRSVLNRQGPFSTSGSLTDWVDWYLRFIDTGAIVETCPELVTRRRIHGDNATLRDPAGMQAYVRMVKASIDRRRRTQGEP